MALSKIRNDSLADTAVHGRRNHIINGAMQVAQRGTSTTGVMAQTILLTDLTIIYQVLVHLLCLSLLKHQKVFLKC